MAVPMRAETMYRLLPEKAHEKEGGITLPKLVIAEKPSVAQSIAKVIGAYKRQDGYMEGSGYLVSWCVGHLVGLVQPDAYDERYKKWSYDDLPIVPKTGSMKWRVIRKSSLRF